MNDFGSGQWLHACWIEQQKANAHVSLVKDWQNVGLYEGFVMGVISGLRMRGAFLSIPDGVTNGEIFKVVGKYLDTHPKELNSGADVLVVKALKANWPAEG